MTFAHDKELHEYRLNGQQLPSVTDLVSPLVDLSMVPADRLEFARDRGTAVHLATELDDNGNLDETSVDPVNVLPRLQAWRKFRGELNVEIVVCEEPMYHTKMFYGGTPDRGAWVTLNRQRFFAVIDIKNVAKMSPVTAVQLTGYDLMLADNGYPPADALLGVQLLGNGEYRLHQYKRETPMFLSLFTIHNWKTRHGI